MAGWPALAAAADPAAKPNDDRQRAARLKLLRQLAEKVQVSLAEWYYGFNRVAFAELHVRFDDKELWTAPRLTTTAPTEAYHLIPIRLGGQ
jgi:hypothetical protein